VSYDEVIDEAINLIKSFENADLYEVEIGDERLTNREEELQVHEDSTDNFAVGYGLDLSVRDRGEIEDVLDETNNEARNNNEVDIFDYDNFLDAVEELKDLSEEENDERAIDAFIEEHAEELQLPSVEYASLLFDVVASDMYSYVEGVANNGTDEDYHSDLTGREKSAIFSMVYNSGYSLFFQDNGEGGIDFNEPYNSTENLRDYIDNKNDDSREESLKSRTRVWYELRYNSSSEAWNEEAGGRGLAKRRYCEGDIFGLFADEEDEVETLYDGDQLTSEESRWILEKLRDDDIQKDGISSIEEIAEYFEDDYYAPDLVEENRMVGDEMSEISDIITELEEAINPVEEIQTEAENNDRELDNLTYDFLKKYDEKYGILLDEKRPIYHSVKQIEQYNDLLIFALMEKLVINMEKEEKKAIEEDDELYISIKELKNRSKKTLEEVIKEKGGYKRLAYKNDNNKDLKDRKSKEKLIDAFKPRPFNAPDTKKSHKFFKSFITEEDKKKQLAEKEEKEKQKRKEELEKIKAEKEEERQRRMKLAKKRRQKAKERIKKREGFIIVNEGEGHKLKRRKDYYGV
jgi:hypothetical protein